MRLDRRAFLKLSTVVAAAAGARLLPVWGSGEADATPASKAASLPSTILVRFGNGRQESMALDEYVKGVIEAEMATGWPIEALKAQAVAARTYAAQYFSTRGYVSEAGQAYKASRHGDTSAAVDATRGQVMTYKGSLILPNYFAQCNGVTTRDSEHALNWRIGKELGWNRVAYLRARPCTGHAAYTGASGSGYRGHGVGMCQTGAKDRAVRGAGYQEILASYFTDVQIVSLPFGSDPKPS